MRLNYLQVVLLSVLGMVAVPSPAQQAPDASPPAKPVSTCEALSRDWRNVEVKLAKSDAEGISDNSAPRATMRAVQDNNELLLASMTLTLMREHKCTIPKRAPAGITYLLPALECRNEQLKGNIKAPQCDTSGWKALGQ